MERRSMARANPRRYGGGRRITGKFILHPITILTISDIIIIYNINSVLLGKMEITAGKGVLNIYTPLMIFYCVDLLIFLKIVSPNLLYGYVCL